MNMSVQLLIPICFLKLSVSLEKDKIERSTLFLKILLKVF